MRSGARLGVIFTLFIMLAGSPAGLVAEGMVGPASSSPPAEDGGAPVAVNGDEAEPGTPVAGAHLAEEEDNGSFTHMPFDGRYQNYYTYDTLSIELQELAAEYSDICVLYDIAKWTERGSTWGGRAVWAMKISDDPGFDDPDEDEVLIIGNHHAREWMSFEVPMYLIHYLLTNYGVEPADNDGDGLLSEDPLNGMDDDGDGLIDEDWNEAQATWLVENREIWVVPMLNPDGTIYDQELSEPGGAGGSWRKNIRDNNLNGRFDPRYDGVDLNRNFPFHWDEPLGMEGRSVDSDVPSSDVYRGPPDNHDDDGDSIVPPALQRLDIHDSRRQDYIDDHIDEDPWDGIDNDHDGMTDEDKDGGFSEPETMALEELMKRLDTDGDHHNMLSDVPVAISYHSYSALVLWPWGYTNAPSPNNGLLEHMGYAMADMTGYRGESTSDLYLANGDCTDWLYGSHGTLAFTIELNTGSDGGFKPAPPYIVNTSRLNLQCNLYIAENADRAAYAKVMGMSDLGLDLPVVNHTQKKSMVSDLDRYPVEATVTRPQLIAEGTVVLHYSTDGGSSWKQVVMDEGGEGRFHGSIPPQKDGDEVRYYVTADFGYTDGLRQRTIVLSAPYYAPGEHYSYGVDAFLSISATDLAALVLGMLFFFTITWGGFGKAVHIALNAEKRKAAQY